MNIASLTGEIDEPVVITAFHRSEAPGSLIGPSFPNGIPFIAGLVGTGLNGGGGRDAATYQRPCCLGGLASAGSHGIGLEACSRYEEGWPLIRLSMEALLAAFWVGDDDN